MISPPPYIQRFCKNWSMNIWYQISCSLATPNILIFKYGLEGEVQKLRFMYEKQTWEQEKWTLANLMSSVRYFNGKMLFRVNFGWAIISFSHCTPPTLRSLQQLNADADHINIYIDAHFAICKPSTGVHGPWNFTTKVGNWKVGAT